MKIGVLYIHGVHGYTRGYADLLHENAVDTADVELLGRDDLEIVPQTVYWADIFEAQRKQLRGIGDHLGWRRLRDFVASSVAHAVGYEDALGYGAYEAVHARIETALGALEAKIGPKAPVIICAHSLGTVITSNLLWDHQRRAPMPVLDSVKGVVTMGCPIALYASRWADGGQPFSAASSGIIWQNLIARPDVLAWPITGINSAYAQEVDADILVKAAGFLQLTPFAHCNYWKSLEVADRLGELIARVYRETKRKTR